MEELITADESISKEQFQEWAGMSLIDKDDTRKIAEFSRALKLRDGQGYSEQQIRNVLRNSAKTTPELVKLAISYYDEKRIMRDNIIRRASSSAMMQ